MYNIVKGGVTQMILPEKNMNIIKEKIKEKIKDIYNKYLSKDENLDIFIDKIVSEADSEILSYSEINDVAFKNLISRIRRTKSRWVEKEQKERLGLYNEVYIVGKGLYEISEEKFFGAYKLNNPEELYKEKLKELKKWRENDDTLLIDFLYINVKMKYQIKSALINDCKFLYVKYIEEELENKKKNLVTKFPKVMSNVPYDHTNRAKLNLQKIGTSKGVPVHYVDKYLIDDKHVFESLIDAKHLKDSFIKGIVGALNEIDFSTFMNLLSLADESFYTTREIIVPTRKLVVLHFGEKNTGAKNYLAIRDSLFKMQYLTIGVIDASKRGFSLKILDNVDIYSIDNKEMVRVLVNEDIVRQIVENNTINMYSDVINGFKLNASRLLIMKLQMERISLSSQSSQGGPLVKKVAFNFFRGVLYFSDKKKYRNIKTVENALNEIMESKITLKSFIRKGDIFQLEFYPISQKEKRDLFIYSEKKLKQRN